MLRFPRTLCLLAATASLASAASLDPSDAHRRYRQVIDATVGMVDQAEVQRMAGAHGLAVQNLTWEDTGRFHGSAVGPNISDMTIQVAQQDPRSEQFQLFQMPVIRYPNFEDRSADISPDRFYLLVGNEKGNGLKRVSLRELLGDLRAHLSRPGSWAGSGRSLLAERDTHVLVSAQACFLPIPREGAAEFTPVLFNYQSSEGNPAVLSILATREGTSISIVDNHQEPGAHSGGTWGQRLYFNQDGQRAAFTGKRLSDFVADGDAKHQGTATPTAASQEGLNMVLLIQVPLKHREPVWRGEDNDKLMMVPAPSAVAEGADMRSDVESAVIGHGKLQGPFAEMANLPIERDERFPIRVTVQFYKATSNGAVSDADLTDIAGQIDHVYRDGDYVGSLVTQGPTGRPTEWTGATGAIPGWWGGFWERYEANTHEPRAVTLEKLHRRFGRAWSPDSPEALGRAIIEVEK